MSVPRYPTYKETGVEWLGSVPAHWQVSRNKILFREIDQRSSSDDGKLLTVSHLTGVTPRSEKNVNMTMAETLEGYKICRAGDLVINTMWAWMGALGMSPCDGLVSPSYNVYRPRNIGTLDPSYYDYLFRTPALIVTIKAHSTGVWESRLRLYPDTFLALRSPSPPREEQSAIASFLDRETGKIEDLVAEQQRLLGLLAEKRKAVISHAITKGLNLEAPMKDSGIDWIGSVPAHWGVVPFSSTISFQEGPGILAVDFKEFGVPLLRVSGVQGRWATLQGCNFLDSEKVAKRWNHFRLSIGDLLISASASMGTVCEVGTEAEGAIPYTGLIRLVGKAQVMTKDFVRAIVGSSLFATQIDLLKAGATIQHFGPTHLREMKVPCPPLSEQREITEFIDRQHRSIDALIQETERGMVLLQERRAALITAAVTGKIDVRGLVAARPETEIAA